MNSAEMVLYEKRMNDNINNVKKVFYNYFDYCDDFTRNNEEIINEIEQNVKQNVQTIYLISTITQQIVNETYKKYTIKDKSNIETVNQFLTSLYSTIISDVYNHLYPHAYF